jgi:putative effector of murein hydrolase
MFNATMLLLLASNILITWLVFILATKFYHRCKQFPLAHPLILSSLTLVALLTVFEIPISDYQANSQVIRMMLAPATVALGVPLYKNVVVLVKYKSAIILPLLIGAIISPCSALLLLWLFKVDNSLLLSMISKSITSPIAIDITKLVGGIPAIAVIFVIISGIIGAAIATPLFSILAIKHDISKGLSLGIASHAIGTASAVQISEQCAAFSVLAMCLNGLLTTLIIVCYILF